MNYIVFDLEWNQSKNTKNNSKFENKNADILKQMPFEIVEIGAVKLDENFQNVDTFSRLIKPSFYKKMSPIISEITGIRDSDLKNQKGFQFVMREFIEWCGDDYIMCTFGNQDIYELGINMHFHNVKIPWSYPMYYIDIQRIFGIIYGKENEQKSLEMVSMYMGIAKKKAYHRALNDAIYTAEILKKLNQKQVMENRSLDYFMLPINHKAEKENNVGTHLEYLTAPYENKDDLLNDKNVFITRCPQCMKKCKKKIRWFLDGSKYVCIAKCENHGLMEGILYIKNNYNGYYGVKKTVAVGTERLDEIAKRKNIIREKRRLKRLREKQNSEG